MGIESTPEDQSQRILLQITITPHFDPVALNCGGMTAGPLYASTASMSAIERWSTSHVSVLPICTPSTNTRGGQILLPGPLKLRRETITGRSSPTTLNPGRKAKRRLGSDG